MVASGERALAQYAWLQRRESTPRRREENAK